MLAFVIFVVLQLYDVQSECIAKNHASEACKLKFLSWNLRLYSAVYAVQANSSHEYAMNITFHEHVWYEFREKICRFAKLLCFSNSTLAAQSKKSLEVTCCTVSDRKSFHNFLSNKHSYFVFRCNSDWSAIARVVRGSRSGAIEAMNRGSGVTFVY